MDEDLLKGLAAGDAAVYRQVYDRYGPALFRTAMRLLGSSSDAEDAVQEVFAAMVRGRARLSQVTNLKAYLFAALRHVVGRILRSRRQRPAIGLNEAQLSRDCPATDAEQTEQLWIAVGRLPPEQREVLALKIQAELTFKEIGEICGLSLNTVASRYRYALEKLKQMMETHE